MDQIRYCRNGHLTDVLSHNTIPIKIPVRLFPGMGGRGPKCKQSSQIARAMCSKEKQCCRDDAPFHVPQLHHSNQTVMEPGTKQM